MSVQDSIDPGDMPNWDRPVRDLVGYLVNEAGIRFRWHDSNHLSLYPPDGVSRPFKISASRPGEKTLEFIQRQFMKVYGVPGPDGTVPYAASDTQEGAQEPGSTEVDQGPAAPENAAHAAILTLAQTLGVDLSTVGGVSEVEYQRVCAERDECEAEALGVMAELDLTKESLEAITEQRDGLLVEVERLAGVIDAAHAMLERDPK